MSTDPRGDAMRTAADVAVVVAALGELAVPDRAAVELIYFHGCTQAEIAARCAVTQAEVRRRVARALLGLGTRLREQEGAGGP